MAVCHSAIVGHMEQHAAPADTPDTAVATSELVDDELLVEASIELACVHRIDWRPLALPARVRNALEKKPQ